MLLLDGGSTAISHFLPNSHPSIPPPLSKFWTSAYAKIAPSAVQSWHTSFLAAGSEIITTSTYQLPLQEDSPESDIPGLVRVAVQVALNAIEEVGRGSIALSFGTRNAGIGKEEYATEAKFTIGEYAEFHRKRIHEFYHALGELWKNVTYLAFETISSIEEAQAIISVLSDDAVGRIIQTKKAWITFSCGDASLSRMSGIFARLLESPETSCLWGIGFNCVGIDIAVDLAKMAEEKLLSTDLTLVIYPDAGNWAARTSAQFTYDAPVLTEQEIGDWAETMSTISKLNQGRVLLGGCCNTDSRFISALVKMLN